MEEKYNFEIVFQKLEEIKQEINMDQKEFILIQQVDEDIRVLKEYYENSSGMEIQTFTKS